MKRTFAILMLLIANMIILVHAVVPHHHHDKVAVALAALCEEDDCHQHSHNGSQQTPERRQGCELPIVLGTVRIAVTMPSMNSSNG